jgi:hypothetical protein
MLAAPPVSMEIAAKEAMELQKYLDRREMPLVGNSRSGINDRLIEHMASIQYILLSEEFDLGYRGTDNKTLHLSGLYDYEISLYENYFV